MLSGVRRITAANDSRPGALAARLSHSTTWHAVTPTGDGHLETACGQTWKAAWMTDPRLTDVSCWRCLRRLAGRE